MWSPEAEARWWKRGPACWLRTKATWRAAQAPGEGGAGGEVACGGEGSGLGPGMPTGAQRDQPHHEPPKGQPVPLSHASQQGSCHDCCRQLPSHGALLLCLRHTQLWPESGRGQESLAEVTYPTPVTSQDPSMPHPKVSFHIPFSRGSPSVSLARRTDQGRRGSNGPPFPTRKGAPHHLSFLRASRWRRE